MNKLLGLIILIGGGMWWQERHGSIGSNAARYKIEYAGSIETPSRTAKPLQKSSQSHAPAAKKQPQNLSPKQAAIVPNRSHSIPFGESTLIAAGIAFPQGSLSVRVVRDRIDCQARPAIGIKTPKKSDRQHSKIDCSNKHSEYN